MSRYRISDDDKVHAAEFKRNLETGNRLHSPGLQRVLNLMRGGPKAGKYVLVVEEAHRRWRLGRMPHGRGDPVEVLAGYEFSDLKEAEWTVFVLRWNAHTGKALTL